MLIEFSVTNHRSLRKRQTFSMAMAKGDELVDSNSFETVAHKPLRLLRSATVYGPNAGGKSNFLGALHTMRQTVLKSVSSQSGDSLPVTPFLFSRSTAAAPSEFEVTFVVDAIRYQYGFSASAERVYEEWLFAWPKGRAQRWFGRTWDEGKGQYHWELGSSLSGEKQIWQKSTRENALFLSTAVQLNSQQLQPVYNWFKNTLRVVYNWDPVFSASFCKKEDQKVKVLDFLKAADLHIEGIRIESEPFDTRSLPDDMPEALRAMIADELMDQEILNIKTVHTSVEGEPVQLDFDEESDGTQKLFSLAGPWTNSLANGCVLFIDELHDNLHPSLVQFLVQLFHSDKTNPNNAQLVFTTHETSILSQDIFRRDQIWFCEKDENQASTLYPLTDFSPRKGRENLELAYFSGRYGALPFVRSPDTVTNGYG